MNRLKGLRCYLAGPIDQAPDDGVEWRKRITPWLEQKGVMVLDPCDKPIPDSYYKEIDDEKIGMMRLKNTGRYFELSQRMKEIVHMDLRMVDISDFVVVYLDPDIPTTGTTHELINSLAQRKPTLVVVQGGKKFAPNWLFGIMDFNFMFDDFKQLYSFLQQINDGGIMGDLSRWVFFDMDNNGDDE